MSSTDNSITTGLEGVGMGFASAFGFGSLYDPNGDLEKELASAKQNLQTTLQNGTVLAFQTTNLALQAISDSISSYQGLVNEQILQLDQLINNNAAKENLFLSSLFIVILVIIFFDLFKKNVVK